MSRSIRRRAGAAVIAAGALTIVGAPPTIAATPPEPIHLEVLTTEGGADAFVATGPTCHSGTVQNSFLRYSGYQSGTHTQILIGKWFTCGNGEGTFTLLLRVTVDFRTLASTGNWSVVSGTGSLEDLRGAGTLTGTPQPGSTIFDVYDGRAHLG